MCVSVCVCFANVGLLAQTELIPIDGLVPLKITFNFYAYMVEFIVFSLVLDGEICVQ